MIILKTSAEIEQMRRAGSLVGQVLEKLREHVVPGASTRELDAVAEGMIRSRGGVPSFKGYRGYPASICASVNNEIIHGIPGDRTLAEGDIVSIDCGAILGGYHGDAAVTFPVGSVSVEAEKLMTVTREALEAGIEMARPEMRLGDIGYAIQKHVEANGFSVVRDFVGHGIGRHMHEDPQIPNFGPPGMGHRLRSGMVLAIEPMVNAGVHEVVVMDDGWTACTRDGSLSAHFEHTVAITDDGPEVLTLP
ncbi:MAG: type I methionyl aminopeptidase [Firmicutes bacterium]|jgi:methionyl aminopeptidase|nr:type I methionyl aminopeptidase [Bacillota bacterium]MDD4336007.1 type I methionyl aminopeptidase [Bacillota bacterium]MDD4791551.1 type I methionyl aminopeptidase [Bacillota bacterium]